LKIVRDSSDLRVGTDTVSFAFEVHVFFFFYLSRMILCNFLDLSESIELLRVHLLEPSIYDQLFAVVFSSGFIAQPVVYLSHGPHLRSPYDLRHLRDACFQSGEGFVFSFALHEVFIVFCFEGILTLVEISHQLDLFIRLGSRFIALKVSN